MVPFTGRAAELEALERWCLDVRAGRVRLVSGEGGSGKTRLALELGKRLAGRGWRFVQVGEGRELYVVGLWTVNIIKTAHGQIPSPAAWCPGRSYVTWVGIDAYYLDPSWRFVSTFGPTIIAVRELTGDPIIIAETSVKPVADRPAKMADLFAGVRTYGLLGFVWFNVWPEYRINGPGAIAALRQGATDLRLPGRRRRRGPLVTIDPRSGLDKTP